MANQPYPTGVRPHSNGRAIQIRFAYRGHKFSQYLPLKPTKTNLKRAADIRDERINALTLQHQYGYTPTTETETPFKLFFEVAQEYLDNAELAVTTRGNYRSALNNYWMPKLANIPINAIDHKMLKQALHGHTGISWKTKKNILIPLKQVFKFAYFDMEYINTNPTDRLTIKNGQKPTINPFTLDERERILSALTGQAQFFYLIAFETGMRCPSEILGLTWQDWDGKHLHVNKARVIGQLKESTKTNKARQVLVTKRLRKRLMEEQLQATGKWLFMNTQGNPMRDADTLTPQWRRALESARVDYRRAYNCRHTYASIGLTGGIKPAFLAKQLGHSLEMFYGTYADWISSEDDAAELEKLENFTKVAQKVAQIPPSKS